MRIRKDIERKLNYFNKNYFITYPLEIIGIRIKDRLLYDYYNLLRKYFFQSFYQFLPFPPSLSLSLFSETSMLCLNHQFLRSKILATLIYSPSSHARMQMNIDICRMTSTRLQDERIAEIVGGGGDTFKWWRCRCKPQFTNCFSIRNNRWFAGTVAVTSLSSFVLGI